MDSKELGGGFGQQISKMVALSAFLTVGGFWPQTVAVDSASYFLCSKFESLDRNSEPDPHNSKSFQRVLRYLEGLRAKNVPDIPRDVNCPQDKMLFLLETREKQGKYHRRNENFPNGNASPTLTAAAAYFANSPRSTKNPVFWCRLNCTIYQGLHEEVREPQPAPLWIVPVQPPSRPSRHIQTHLHEFRASP